MSGVKIDVSANTTGAAAQVKQVDQATAGLAKSMDQLAKTSKAATDQVARLEAVQRRLRNVQGILSKEFGRSVDPADATMFLSNFERMKGGGGFGSHRMRQFGSFEDWYSGAPATYQNQAAANRHRQFILAGAMRGTPFAGGGGAMPPLGGAGAAGGGGGFFGRGGAGGFAGGAGSMAMGVFKGGLALAGIGSIFSTIKAGFDNFKEESLSLDTAKRLAGDLGVSFDDLKTKSREAAIGLGMTFKESAALTAQLARTTGNLSHMGDLRTSIGFARAFGLAPGASADFFGTSRRTGAIGGGQDDEKRFAYMIAQAIDRSGYAGQAAEIVGSIKSFTESFSRRNLAAPPVGAFAGALSGLTSSGIPGLDPAGAAGILNTADSAVRGGGGGKWGSLLLMQALMGRSKGMGNNTFAAQYLWEQGMFGSTGSAFGKGENGKDSPLAAMLKSFGAGGLPELSGTSNFSKIKSQFTDTFKGMGWAAPGAFGQLFGLNAQQGAALYGMTPQAFGSLDSVMGKLGIKLSDVSASGIGNISKIANSGSFSELGDMAGEYLGGDKLTGDERKRLSAAQGGRNMDALRDVLVQVAARHGQEDTPGSNLRQMAASLANIETLIGEGVAKPLEFLAEVAGWDPQGKKAAEYADRVAAASSSTGEFDIGIRPEKTSKSIVSGWSKAFDKQFLGLGPDAALAKAIAGEESGFDPNAKSATSSATGLFQFIKGTWDKFGGGGNPRNPDDATAAYAREIGRFRGLGASTDEQFAMGHHYGEGHLFDPPDALAQKEAGEAASLRSGGYGAVDVNINVNGKPAQTIRAPLNAGAPPSPSGGMPIAVPF